MSEDPVKYNVTPETNDSEKSMETRTPFVTSGFATRPEDLEKYFSISGGEDTSDSASIGDFEHARSVCEKYGTHIAMVIDAEGEYVCFAPQPIAKLIKDLLNEWPAMP